MAKGIENYPNIDTTDPTNYPNGNIKDDPAGLIGTPINKLTTADIHQTFYRALNRSNITANNTPDNATNGYQYALALGLEAWQAGGTIYSGTTLPLAGGSFVMGTIVYDKMNRRGKTLTYQFKATGCTVSGTVSTIYLTIGNLTNGFKINALALTFMQICGFAGTNIIYSTHENAFGFGFGIKKADGTNFAAGSVDLNISITAELD